MQSLYNRFMQSDEKLKKYDLHKNKGYGTKKHMEAINSLV